MKLNSIRAKITFITTITIAVILIIFATVMIMISNNELLTSVIENESNNMNIYINGINQNLDNISNIALRCASDINLKLAMHDGSKYAWLNGYYNIETLIKSNPSFSYINRLIITDSNFRRFMQFGNDISNSKPLDMKVIKNEFGEKTGEFGNVKQSRLSFTKDWETSMILPIIDYNTNQTLGNVYVAVSLTKLFEDISHHPTNGYYNISIFGTSLHFDNATLSQNASAPDAESISPYKNHLNTEKRSLYKVKKNEAIDYMLEIKDEKYGLVMALNFKQPSIRNLSSYMVLLLVFVISSVIILFLILSIYFSGILYRPIKKLANHINKIREGDFSTDRTLETDNEFGIIGSGINSLSVEVTSLMEKKIQDEKNRMELEYMMLQNQINPHFIYNTLNSIKWMATIQKADGIAEMVTSLARLMKMISKSNTMIRLEDEIAFTEDYFLIMRYRYGNTISYYNKIGEGTKDAMIPRFTLQPIVENAIFHGLEPKGSGEVAIVTERLGKNVSILIADNGIGYVREEVEKEKHNGMFRSIGIENITKRLEYTFKGQAMVATTSIPDIGTSVTIRIPYQTEVL